MMNSLSLKGHRGPFYGTFRTVKLNFGIHGQVSILAAEAAGRVRSGSVP